MEKFKLFIKENYGFIIVVVVIILIRIFIVTPVRVNGTSMDDTLQNGDIMLLYKLSDIKRNDIVVIKKKFSGDSLIKRIIALPGEKIKCEDGIIYINDHKYDDKFASNETNDFEEVKLKNDEYYVLGDNRVVSKDSRMLGPVNKDFIAGTTSLILFPFSRMGNKN